LVARLIARRTRLVPTAIESPETTVATGAVATVVSVTTTRPAGQPSPPPTPPRAVPRQPPPKTPPRAVPTPQPTPPRAVPAPVAYQPPPAAPKRRNTTPWWIAAVATILIIGAVATVIVLNRGDEQDGAGEQRDPTTPTKDEKPAGEGDPLTLGPTEYAAIALYMDFDQALATGQLSDRSDVPAGCEEVPIVGEHDAIIGSVYFNDAGGYVVDIVAAANAATTPEGIVVGSTLDDVLATYADTEDLLGAHGHWVAAKITDGTAEYRFELSPDDSVLGMSLSAADESCLG